MNGRLCAVWGWGVVRNDPLSRPCSRACACRSHTPPHNTTQLVAILLFQVLGAALVVNEYQAQGLVSRALMKLAGLLAGLAFLPPVAVAVRETLPSHARNPFVRALSCVLELALDVVCVSSVALLASILLTAVMALPGLHEKLLSYQLAEEYVKGALSAGAVMVFLWAFAKNFEALATKWFM